MCTIDATHKMVDIFIAATTMNLNQELLGVHVLKEGRDARELAALAV